MMKIYERIYKDTKKYVVCGSYMGEGLVKIINN